VEEAIFEDLVKEEPGRDWVGLRRKWENQKKEGHKSLEGISPREQWAACNGKNIHVLIGKTFIDFGNWRVIDDFTMSSF
jgi:hypothetical protein